MGASSCCVEKSVSKTSLVSHRSLGSERAYKVPARNAEESQQPGVTKPGCSKKSSCKSSAQAAQKAADSLKSLEESVKSCANQRTESEGIKRPCCGVRQQADKPKPGCVQAVHQKKSCCNKSSSESQESIVDARYTNSGHQNETDSAANMLPCESKTPCCEPDQAPKLARKSLCEAKADCCNLDEKNGRSETKVPSLTITQDQGSDQNNIPTLSPSDADLEKGPSALEHLIVSVQGMTCTGCETKLSKSLLALPGIRNIRTSLVRAEAEFDIDLSASKGTVENTIQSLERMTNFTCKQVIQRAGTLDVVVGGAMEPFLNQKLPSGVETIFNEGGHQAQIIYNPRVIGARDVTRILLGPHDTLSSLNQRAMDAGRNHLRTAMWMTILSAALTIPVLVLAWAPLPKRETIYGAVSLGLATMVQFIVAGPFYPKALNALFFACMVEMDLLVIISTSTAYIFSVVAYVYTVQGRPLEIRSFFETSTLLVTLIMCGRVATAYARQKATESVSVESLQATKATILNGGDKETLIDSRLLQYGDVFKVYPDMIVPTDGMVLSGSTEVDESMVTGEANLIPKTAGSTLIAGSINRTGAVTVRLTRLPNENTITNIADMVNEANFSKPKVQELADRVATYFVPTIFAITIIIFVVWIAVGKAVQGRNTSNSVVNALTYALSALIVSCPCAIGLAVPMVIVVAGDIAAKNGLIFRVGETIISAHKVSHVIFDKTGTITQGKPIVVSEIYMNESEEITTAVALALTSESKHPVSTAIATHMSKRNAEPLRLSNPTAVVGKGVEAILPGTHTKVRGGNVHWLGVTDNPQIQPLLAQNLTVFCISRDSTLLAAFGLQDTLRPDAKTLVSQLEARGINISIVSGDEENAVRAVADQLNISATNTRFRCSPADKKKYIEDLTASSVKPVTTLFIGDGTNDAPALAQASIGIHVNDGTEVAKSASDVVLLTPSLQGILVLIDLSKAVMNRIKFNFGWSFIYNTLAISLAAGAFVNARIPPAYAGLGELVSVLPVIFAALQLRWVNLQYP
jgi:heavy metal translocating P-type ATPase